MHRDLERRVPPHNIEAEQAVVGFAMTSGNGFELLDGLVSDDFYSPAHKTLFGAINDLSKVGTPVDMLTVAESLGESISTIGGPVYLAEIADCVVSQSRVEHYVKILKQKSTLRKTIEAGIELLDTCYNEQDAVLATEQATRALSDISSQSIGRGIENCTTVLGKTLKTLEHRHAHPGLTGIPTGFYDLDAITNGLQNTDLIYLAARPSMGKTTLAINCVKHIAIGYETPVGVFSLEMSSEQIMEKILSYESDVPFESIKSGRLSEQDWLAIHKASDNISTATILIDDTPGLRVGELKARARKMVRSDGVKVIFIDYLQLMRSDHNEQNREREIGYISSELKGLAKELNIPVVALSQLNRGLEQRTNKRPIMSDLRDSGSLEQDADIVAFIYRDAVYNKSDDNPFKNVTELIISKHRNGRCGTVFLTSRLDVAAFYNQNKDGLP